MGLTALVIATTCYAVAAVDLARRKDAPMAIVFAAYAVANCALLYAGYRAPITAWLRTWL